MAHGTDLKKLPASLPPRMMEDDFVFCSGPDTAYGDFAGLRPLASLMKAEGVTMMVSREVADKAGLTYDAVSRGTTLRARSGLEVVDFTAAIEDRVADGDINANKIAVYFYDDIFAPAKKGDRAVTVLKHGLVDPNIWRHT